MCPYKGLEALNGIVPTLLNREAPHFIHSPYQCAVFIEINVIFLRPSIDFPTSEAKYFSKFCVSNLFRQKSAEVHVNLSPFSGSLDLDVPLKCH